MLAALVLVLIAAGGAMWTFVFGPELRAREVADVLAGRTYDEDRLSDGPLDFAWKRVIKLKRAAGLEDVVHDVTWGTHELIALAHSHPAALAHAAIGESVPDVRFALLDAIEDSGAYATELPRDLMVEHVTSHAIFRLDKEPARPLSEAQVQALNASRELALRGLRQQLVHGHCGALAGYKAIHAKPALEEILAGTAAIATAAADASAELSVAAQDSCRERFAKMAAPTTDGEFDVRPGAH